MGAFEIISKELAAQTEEAVARTKTVFLRQAGRLLPLSGQGVDSLFDTLVADALRDDGRRQMDFTLELAKAWDGESSLGKLLRERWDEYLDLHPLCKRADRGHEAFAELEALLRKTLSQRVKFFHQLLQGEGETFEALMRSSYARAQALAFIRRQMKQVDQIRDLLEAEPGLLALPGVLVEIGRPILSASLTEALQLMEERIKAIYGQTARARAQKGRRYPMS